MLAMEAKKTRDMGVVGSTSNILDFITSKVKCALEKPFADKLQVSSLQAAKACCMPCTARAVHHALLQHALSKVPWM